MNDQTPMRLARTVMREQEMKFGTQLTPTGCRFRLWAPKAQSISLKLHEPAQTLPMTALRRGWFELEVENIGHGARYKFVTEDGAAAQRLSHRRGVSV